MPGHNTATLTFYPAYCFPSSPTYNKWVKLTAAGVRCLRERRGFEGIKLLIAFICIVLQLTAPGQNLFFHLNHPIQWVQVTGIVVGFEHLSHLWRFYIDDGSGHLLEIVMPREQPPALPDAKSGGAVRLVTERRLGRSDLGNQVDFDGFDIGSLVKAKGGIKVFRGEKQMTLERLFVLADSQLEVHFWFELAVFHQSVLSCPWILSAAEQRRLKEEVGIITRRLEDRRAKKNARELKSHAEGSRSKLLKQQNNGLSRLAS
ncbi:MAG: hypothetical protein MMC23_008939 [Stictis urceolatum]|nr:hypothetical protein [Stictis urceolata]